MSTSSEQTAVPVAIQRKLEAAGLRRTLLTRAVLGHFLGSGGRESDHAQVMAALAARGLVADRVTVYRLLDRLAACAVLLRHADGASRTWRYRLAPSSERPTVAQFECDRCHVRYDIPGPHAAAPLAPLQQVMDGLASLGHSISSIHGTCAQCVLGAQPPQTG